MEYYMIGAIALLILIGTVGLWLIARCVDTLGRILEQTRHNTQQLESILSVGIDNEKQLRAFVHIMKDVPSETYQMEMSVRELIRLYMQANNMKYDKKT